MCCKLQSVTLHSLHSTDIHLVSSVSMTLVRGLLTGTGILLFVAVVVLVMVTADTRCCCCCFLFCSSASITGDKQEEWRRGSSYNITPSESQKLSSENNLDNPYLT